MSNTTTITFPRLAELLKAEFQLKHMYQNGLADQLWYAGYLPDEKMMKDIDDMAATKTLEPGEEGKSLTDYREDARTYTSDLRVCIEGELFVIELSYTQLKDFMLFFSAAVMDYTIRENTLKRQPQIDWQVLQELERCRKTVRGHYNKLQDIAQEYNKRNPTPKKSRPAFGS